MTNREIDALVAEKVMGCSIKYYENAFPPYQQVPECGCRPRQHGDVLNLPPYSTDIAAATAVIREIQTMPMPIPERFVFEIERSAYDGDTAVALIRGERGHYPDKMLRMILPEPRVICLAALEAVGAEVLA